MPDAAAPGSTTTAASSGMAAVDGHWGSLAATPPMGWNSWNQVHEAVTEDVVIAAAEAMVSRGLVDAGYEYVVVDDCWQSAERTPEGLLLPNPGRFPRGMKAVADHVHSLGLKFGMYSAPGERTCAGRLGSSGHEERDASMFAEWGVDFLKYDWCGAGPLTPESVRPAFERMRDPLVATGRDIVYSVSEYGVARPWEWGRGTAHLWRTTFDIWPHWGSVFALLNQQWAACAGSGPGGWADPDMLQVGNGTLTPEENRSHMALWALLPAPLFAGNDLAAASDDVVRLLTHPGLIAVNQDPLGRRARLVAVTPEVMVWARELAGGDLVLGVLNHTEGPVEAAVPLVQAGVVGRCTAVDVFSGRELGEPGVGYKAVLERHDTAVLRFNRVPSRP
ncbi:glycoside hydrolase family 27 protein [Zafaria sp. J156]|uniref:glycoside hydrolase family 27 protein n=1 Tax=Zafaria sp. J156 TaxID=3116490 RepID=UPI002E7801FB|nr:glycoside hydrolase family 27 protein [Zafaria sp. J156]MEE1620017.1 glycoside hydrolase family 27 protein [Zafaria sp. J156]